MLRRKWAIEWKGYDDYPQYSLFPILVQIYDRGNLGNGNLSSNTMLVVALIQDSYTSINNIVSYRGLFVIPRIKSPPGGGKRIEKCIKGAIHMANLAAQKLRIEMRGIAALIPSTLHLHQAGMKRGWAAMHSGCTLQFVERNLYMAEVFLNILTPTSSYVLETSQVAFSFLLRSAMKKSRKALPSITTNDL